MRKGIKMLLPFTLALFLGTGCQLRDMIVEVRENGKMQESAQKRYPPG